MAGSEDTPVTEGNDTLAFGEEVLLRLLLPTAALVLALLYVNSVHGRISLSNLRYPYFVIAVLTALTLSIYAEEFVKINRMRKEESRPPFVDSVTARIREWQRSIALAAFGFAYLWLIEILGFFVSSALLMMAVMVVAGVRDYRKIVVITAVVLFGIWLFVDFLGMSPPEGIFL